MLRRLVLLAALWGAGFGIGLSYLTTKVDVIGPRYGVSPGWFTTSVMIASGRGFTFPNMYEVPGLVDFLEQRSMSFVPTWLPETIPQSKDSFDVCHPYLLYMVGYTWRLLGVSWAGLKVLLAVLLGVSAVLAYGVFRLGMNRFFSAVGALIYVLTPAVLTWLPSIRDFCKLPLVLAVLLFVGLLLTQRVNVRRLLMYAVGLGLVLGFGVGIRQDLLIFVAPSALVVVLFSRGMPRLPWVARLSAGVAFAVAFLLPAWGVLSNMRTGQSEQAHHVIQGFNTRCMDELGLARGSYEVTPTNNDFWVYAIQNSYERRVNHGTEFMIYDNKVSARAGVEWSLQVMRTLPFDVMMRTIGAIAHGLTDGGIGIPHAHFMTMAPVRPSDALSALAEHLYRWGLLYAALALLLVAAYELRLASFLLLAVVCLCGYVSILFEVRHAFHLSFVPYWFFFFLLDKAVRVVRRRNVSGLLAEDERKPGETAGWWRSACLRMGAFAGAILLVGAGLYFLTWELQKRNLHGLVDKVTQAPRDLLACVQQQEEDWELIRPEQGLPNLGKTPDDVVSEVPTEYLMLELKDSAEDRLVRIRYEQGNPDNDFTTIRLVPGSRTVGDGPLRYYFPVHEVAVPVTEGIGLKGLHYKRGRFIGVELQRASMGDFLGLYRVSVDESVPLLFFLTVAPKPEGMTMCRSYSPCAGPRVRLADCFALLGDCATRIDMLRQAFLLAPGSVSIRRSLAESLVAFAQGPANQENYADASALYREARRVDSRSGAAWCGEGALLEVQGFPGAAKDAYRRAIAADPLYPVTYQYLDTLLAKDQDAAAQVAFWEELSREHPAAGRVLLSLGTAYERADRLNDAEAAYARAGELLEDDLSAAVLRARFLLELDRPGEALAVLEQISETKRRDPIFLSAMGDTLSALGRCAEAVDCFERAIAAAPDALVLFDKLDEVVVSCGGVDRVALWQRMAEQYPAVSRAHSRLAAALMGAGDAESGINAMKRAIEVSPGDASLHDYLGRILLGQGRNAEALDAFRRAHEINPGIEGLCALIEEAAVKAGMDGAAARAAAGCQPAAPAAAGDAAGQENVAQSGV